VPKKTDDGALVAVFVCILLLVAGFVIGFFIFRRHQKNQRLKMAMEESTENIDADGLLK